MLFLGLPFLLGLGLWQGLNFLVRLAVPQTISLETWAAQVPQSNRLWSSDGTLLYTWGPERRQVVPLSAISPELITAVLAVEDSHFYQHGGISWWSVARAMLTNLQEGRLAQGGSTLTQQLARWLYLSSEKRLGRKLAEALLAKRLDETLSKDELLALYLNSIYWGNGAHGAQEAARTYFCRPASDLDRSQALLLAAIIAGPERFNPLKQPQRAQERFQHALGRLRDHLEAQGLHPTLEDLAFPALTPCQMPPWRAIAPQVLRTRALLEAILQPEDLARGGLEVTLGLSWKHQQALLATLDASLDSGILASLKPGPWLQYGPPQDPVKVPCTVRPSQSFWGRLVEYRDGAAILDFGGHPGRIPLDRFQWPPLRELAGPPAPGYWVKASPDEASDLCGAGLPAVFSPVLFPQVATLLISREGQLLAWTGGFGHSSFDRALDSARSVASTIKPFVYLAAMLHWNWVPTTTIPQDWPSSYRGHGGKTWKPLEHGPDYTRTRVSLEEALRLSLNGPPVAVAQHLGLAQLRRDLLAFGLPERPMKDLSVALGNLALAPYDLAVGYGLFFRGGKALAPHPIDQIRDRQGRLLFQSQPALRGEAPPLLAKAVAGMLRGVVDRGTGRGAARDHRVAAGKTGTSSSGTDAWFVGWAGELLLVVWVGSDDGSPQEQLSGPALAAPLWGELMDRLEAIPL